jgi:hypothetical protein
VGRPRPGVRGQWLSVAYFSADAVKAVASSYLLEAIIGGVVLREWCRCRRSTLIATPAITAMRERDQRLSPELLADQVNWLVPCVGSLAAQVTAGQCAPR